MYHLRCFLHLGGLTRHSWCLFLVLSKGPTLWFVRPNIGICRRLLRSYLFTTTLVLFLDSILYSKHTRYQQNLRLPPGATCYGLCNHVDRYSTCGTNSGYSACPPQNQPDISMVSEEEWLIIDANGTEIEPQDLSSSQHSSILSQSERENDKHTSSKSISQDADTSDFISLSPTIEGIFHHLVDVQRIGVDFCESQKESLYRCMTEYAKSAASCSSQAIASAKNELQLLLSSMNLSEEAHACGSSNP